MMKPPILKEESIDWILEQFKHMGASEEDLREEQEAMLLDPVYYFYNLDFFTD